ncbi:MAG: hypothetical protein EOP38_20415 [Rubrivivax sp.]|nr:MAG: hypothetical protein EOP38_20415 [Rubrivivax sp.]
MTRILTASVVALSTLTMSGCALLESGTSAVTLNILEEGFTPPALKMGDVDMGCTFALANGPLVGAARNFYGDPSLMETVLMQSASVCSDAKAIEEELRYIRASREKRSDEAQDARISQKRQMATSAHRQITSFERMRTKLQQKYFFKYGSECPKFKRDFDEMVYLLGSASGVQAVQSDMGAQQAVGVSLDIPPQVDFAMTCLNNKKWWGAPQALRAAIWSIIPGGGDGKDIKGTFESNMAIGERAGVRLPHLMAAIAAQSADDTPTLRAVIKRFATVENFKVNTDYRLVDAIAEAQMVNISDRLWTQNTGSRTPINSLGKFWDDKAGPAIDADNFLK